MNSLCFSLNWETMVAIIALIVSIIAIIVSFRQSRQALISGNYNYISISKVSLYRKEVDAYNSLPPDNKAKVKLKCIDKDLPDNTEAHCYIIDFFGNTQGASLIRKVKFESFAFLFKTSKEKPEVFIMKKPFRRTQLATVRSIPDNEHEYSFSLMCYVPKYYKDDDTIERFDFFGNFAKINMTVSYINILGIKTKMNQELKLIIYNDKIDQTEEKANVLCVK